ncbi:MAG: S1/P1 nuclease [Robiginitomaculum sp.]|nr:S1/P1 nuclease [Robiginitomaculum sp.]
MIKFLTVLVLGIGLALSFASPSFAWGSTAHRATGDIAEAHLSDTAKAEIKSILGPQSLAEASTWPDFMRASPDRFWQREAGSYHYVTIPKGKTYDEVGAPKQGDAISALKKFAKTLRDPKASRDEKALALRFSVHIIGDLHQPLHAGNGKDRGGNQFEVVFFGDVTNLHSVWDRGMIDREGLSYSELSHWLSTKITLEQVTNWNEVDPRVWVAESAAIRDTIYPDNQVISWDYTFAHIGTAHTRISQAGIRMAAYLNAVFAE